MKFTIIGYACYLGIAQAYRTNEQIKRLVKMAIAFALLPSNEAWNGYDMIAKIPSISNYKELRRYVNKITRATDAECRVRVNQFVQYIRSFWMEQIGPERFCVNMDNNRTNNQMEANHRSFNDHVGNPHPNPGYLALRDGTPVRDRRRREYITRDREIRTLQIDQQNGRITIREFLIAAAFRFKPVEIEFQEQNAEEFNRPLDEVHAAFEALLHNPHAVINTPDVGVQEDQMVEIEVVLAAENQLEIAAFEDPVANVSTGRGRGRPRGRGDRKFGEHQDGRRMSNWPLSIQQ
ncbi:hypothetical protein OUZ56_016998 [Daphnia magna]|uniref:Uncharacterized protein n=1 Tax=Daphnia magna TaxID=35525 RepID=A0ABR0ARW4_9CRUS|nr:hypothetical protein OUZ56_016998 [Daphnia magna]